jgi:Ca2+-binding RTX toxin-like protein
VGLVADLSKHTITADATSEVWSIEKLVGTAFDDVMKGDKGANVLVGGAGQDELRGMAGADTLTGGADRDTFVFLKKDVLGADGSHLGLDVVTDFTSSDALDLHDFFKDKNANLDDVFHFRQVTGGTVISATVDGAQHDIVMLQGVGGGLASAWAADGLLLV